MALTLNGAPTLLAPSEYNAEPGTAVGGRVVLSRLFHIKSAGLAKGSQKGREGGKAVPEKETDVCELHILGGRTTSEVLYLYATGESARDLHRAAPLKSLKMFQGLQIIRQRPRTSTSQFSYHARVVPALGENTLVKDLPADAHPSWCRIPMDHPVVDLETIQGVTDTMQVCANVVVESNDGVTEGRAQSGNVRVCNAVVRMGHVSMRTSFWQELADNMAQYGAGAHLFMTQVTVVRIGAISWGLRGCNATQLIRLGVEEGAATQAATDTGALGSSAGPQPKRLRAMGSDSSSQAATESFATLEEV